MSLDKKSKFNFRLYRKYEDKNNIYRGDCVWLTYPENDSYLSFNQNSSKKFKLEKFRGTEYRNNTGIWVVEG